MFDDLANDWGCNYCYPEERRGTSPCDVTEFRQAISSPTQGKFVLLKLMGCGSDANLWAISDATCFNTHACLFAAGSYISGNGGALQPFSSCKFSVQNFLSEIAAPNEIHHDVARANTCGLPYHLPGVLDDEALKSYEDECFFALHISLVQAKMAGKPYEALLLELCLAGNGGTLRDRALLILSDLAVLHGFRIIVDEIMTGGRSGKSMLLLQTKPVSFQDVVSHVTVGKWVSMGIVLVCPDFAENRHKKFGDPISRGASTELNCRSALSHWKYVSEHMHDIPKRRAVVLKQLKIDEDNAWGTGLLIFAPVRRTDSKQGLKCRFLPLLHVNTPVDKIRCVKIAAMEMKETVNSTTMEMKEMVNSTMVQCCLQWAHDNESACLDCSLCTYIATNCNEGDHFSSEQWREKVSSKGKQRETEATLRSAFNASFMHTSLKGPKRKRYWIVDTPMIPPWKKWKAPPL